MGDYSGRKKTATYLSVLLGSTLEVDCQLRKCVKKNLQLFLCHNINLIR